MTVLVTQTACSLQTSMPSCWQSRAPASSMILGEHSVVYGHSAIACALDRFIQIDWQARADNKIHIHSELAEHTTDIPSLLTQTEAIHPQLKFVCHALAQFAQHLSFGLTITIRSEFSSTIGLGSSAAVLAAMLSGLNQITQQQKSLLQLFEIGHALIVTIQGRGSGTDLAASLSGGIIHFQPNTDTQALQINPLLSCWHSSLLSASLTLIYAGYKTPTAQVLEQVAVQWQDQPSDLATLYQKMGTTTALAVKALQAGDLELFYAQINRYQALMTQLGVNDTTLTNLIDQLNNCPSIAVAKISGSGLGDCVLGLGSLEACSAKIVQALNPYQQLQLKITELGANTRATLTTEATRSTHTV